MNMLPATLVSQSEAHTVITLAGGSERIVLPGRADRPITGELTLGVRAEHLGIGAPGEGLAARVELVEHLGDVSILHAHLDGVGQVISLKLDKQDAGQPVGARIGIKVVSSSATLFDANGVAVTFERGEAEEGVASVQAVV
jgi:multiple sugar transport system ATP-binding protein